MDGFVGAEGGKESVRVPRPLDFRPPSGLFGCRLEAIARRLEAIASMCGTPSDSEGLGRSNRITRQILIRRKTDNLSWLSSGVGSLFSENSVGYLPEARGMGIHY